MQDFGHGRIETRIYKTISNLTFLDIAQEWKSMKSIVKIDLERYYKSSGKTTSETRYYINSLSADAESFNKYKRSHWSVENKLHWMLEVHCREEKTKPQR